MSSFLEILKERLAEAQQRAHTAQQKLNVAQVEFQAAMTEFQSWQNAVQVETRREASEAQTTEVPTPTSTAPHEGSQADKVREVLAQHPAGIRPKDIWKTLEGQMKNRAYLYSILNRLKARGEVMERRGKYFFKAQLEGGTREQQIVQ